MVDISAGFWHSLALKGDGTVVAWGNNSGGQTSVPTSLFNVVAIAAGNSGSLALKSDGTVVGWGGNSPPAGLSDVVAISADYHSLALKSDGTVVAWGANSLGESNVPAGLGNVIAVVASGSNSLVLKADGSVAGWGSNIYGQLDVPAGLTGVSAIALGDRSFAIKANSPVIIWGAGLNVGQTRMPANFGGVTALSARSVGNLALLTDSSVMAWGTSFPAGNTTIAQPTILTRAVAISMGNTHAMVLRDNSGTTAPIITTQPVAQSTVLGAAVTLSVGTPATSFSLTFQWRKNGAYIPGATSSSYTINPINDSSAGSYDVLVSNYVAGRFSTPAVISLVSPPAFATQPTSTATVVGQPATLSAAVTGTAATTYQWQKNGVNVPGATQAVFTIAATQPSDAGNYTCIATNLAGSTVSSPALLTVSPATRLANASVRTTLAASQSVIVGFVVRDGSRDVVVRAAGPALAAFGLTSAMSDPRVELYRDSTKLLENDNWPGVLTDTFTSLGAFAFAPGSRDAALQQAVNGSHSAVASGSGPGVVLVEIYDASGATTGRLANVSARNRVGTGADILILGFHLAGSGTKRVLIRAVGPTLGGVPFNLPGTLADPKLELYDARGVKLDENDSWDSALAATFGSVGAFALAPSSKDAALIATLPAGASYTAQVKGSDGGTGEALVEIYELP